MNTTMNPNKALWEKGDFTRIAESMRESGKAFAHSMNVTEGLQVLDLGCGDGTTAIPKAQLGAHVLGVDIAENLVEAGNRRARELGLPNCRFQQGDACDLHGIKDQSFDLVVSVFGAMFAPKPYAAAKEMVRVTKPGGRIVMGNWIPNDPTSFVSQLLKISAAFTPPPPEGFVSPMLWGVESHILDRYAQAGVAKEKVSMVKDTFAFVTTGSPAEFIDSFRRFYGPTMNAFEAAHKNGQADDLLQQLVSLAQAQNQATDGSTTITATFMRVTVSL